MVTGREWWRLQPPLNRRVLPTSDVSPTLGEHGPAPNRSVGQLCRLATVPTLRRPNELQGEYQSSGVIRRHVPEREVPRHE